jgi:hypothetical protein
MYSGTTTVVVNKQMEQQFSAPATGRKPTDIFNVILTCARDPLGNVVGKWHG